MTDHLGRTTRFTQSDGDFGRWVQQYHDREIGRWFDIGDSYPTEQDARDAAGRRGLYDAVKQDLLSYNGHTYLARLNPDHDGEFSWQIFRDDEFTPFGFLVTHRRPDGGFGLLVRDAGGQVLSSNPGGDGCVPSYISALDLLSLFAS